MPKKVPEKTAVEIKNLSKPGLHAVGGVPGLLIQINNVGNKTWILRVVVGTRRRHIGLGGYPAVSLSQAREKAREARAKIESGTDPVKEKQKIKAKLLSERMAANTFKQVAEHYIRKQSLEFKTSSRAKQVQRLENSLINYAYPIIGDILIGDVDKSLILKILEPIWLEKNHTADRLRRNIENIIQMAISLEYRKGPNPAEWKDNLEDILPRPSKVAKAENMKALPVDDLPDFICSLKKREGFSARALEFAILTASRSIEIRGATWQEIDIDNMLWVIPGDRMKGGKTHTVPLSPEAIRILNELPRLYECDYVFPSPSGKRMSENGMSAVLKKMKADVTQHGFRSTFKDWCRLHTNYADEISELALAHVNDDKTRAAYARDELIDKRRLLMADWAKYYCHGHQSNVVGLKQVK